MRHLGTLTAAIVIAPFAWILLRSDFDGGRSRPDRPDHAARPAPDRQVGYPGDPRGRATDGWRTARRS